ncbi:hypothetical protein [Paenibacillus hamazuiensis]|uniref:hypothetical protein n=1 Tax=Paenibacillus hamazuiensis TaxID=2936508 RepID=UPI00200BCDE0|nr:hypothetical protein [Paenibacillus hamazuiensis]
MDLDELKRGVRGYQALCGGISDAVRAGTYTEAAFSKRLARSRAFIAELAASDDVRLRKVSAAMAVILADLPRIDNDYFDARLRKNCRKFNEIMTEVAVDGEALIDRVRFQTV